MRAEILTAIIIASFIFGCIFGIVYETGRRNAIHARKIKRLIELLISAHEECYKCEGVCFLSSEKEKELNDLIEKYTFEKKIHAKDKVH